MTVATHEAFFVAGGTVPPGSPSYVERAADRELLEALLAGEFCYVLNSRQMGKSSLAVRTIARLNDAGVRTAFVDLTRIGGATVTPEQWYAGLLLETGRALGLRAEAAAWLKAHRDVGPAQRLLSFLQEDVLARVEGPVVVMVDEIDAVRSLPFSTDELFAGLRQLHNGRASDPALTRLTVCLLGAALPSDLIRDPRTTPFNVGRRIELRDFTSEEAAPFASGLLPLGGGQGGGAADAEALVARVLHWTGGHPFLTQALCAELASPSPSGSSWRGGRGERLGSVDALVRARYLDARARETDTNLADVGRRLLGEGDPNVTDEDRATTLSLYGAMLRGKPVADDEANPAAARIKMSGVARVEGGNLRVRNRIYAQAFDTRWVRENTPGQELRRQRRAFWKGALRTGAIGTLVVATIAALAVNAEISARQARAAEKESNRQRSLAETNATEARTERDAAKNAQEAETKLATKLRKSLDTQKLLALKADRSAKTADERRQEALRQKSIAENNAAEATRQTSLARLSAQEAKSQSRRADGQKRLALAANHKLEGELYENAIESLPYLWERNERQEAADVVTATAAQKDKGFEWGYWRRLAGYAFTAKVPILHNSHWDSHNYVFAPSEGPNNILYGARGAELIDGRTGKPLRTLWRVPSADPQDWQVDSPRLSFSRNGRWAIRQDPSRRWVLQDLVRGTIRPLPPTTDVIGDNSVSDDGHRYVTYSGGTTGGLRRLTLWDADAGRPLFVRTPPESLGELQALLPDGKAVLLSYRGGTQGRAGVGEYDFEHDRVRTIYALPIPPAAGQRPFVGSIDDSDQGILTVTTPVNQGPYIGLIDASDQNVIIQIEDRVTSFTRGDPNPRQTLGGITANVCSSSSDGRLLLASPEGGERGRAASGTSAYSEVWDLRTGARLGRILAQGILSGDGRLILNATGDTVTAVDWRKALPYDEVQVLHARPSADSWVPSGVGPLYQNLAFAGPGLILSTNGHSISTAQNGGISTQQHNQSFASYDLQGHELGRFPAQGDLPKGTVAYGQGPLLLITSGNNSLPADFRRLPDFHFVRRFNSPECNWPSADSSGRHVVAVDRQRTLKLWTKGDRPSASVPTGLSNAPYPPMPIVSPDGKRVLAFDMKSFKVWEIETLRPVLSAPFVSGEASAGWENSGNTVLLWGPVDTTRYDLASRRRTSMPYVRNLRAVSPDGRLQAINNDGTVEIRSVRSGRKLFALDTQLASSPGHAHIQGGIVGLRFSDDGKSLLVLYDDGKLRTFRSD